VVDDGGMFGMLSVWFRFSFFLLVLVLEVNRWQSSYSHLSGGAEEDAPMKKSTTKAPAKRQNPLV
jgi:hypothetical protein